MNRPLLQIALDNLTLEDAIASLKTGVDEVVDIIECGTILIGSEGRSVIGVVRNMYPDKILCADFKIADSGSVMGAMILDGRPDLMTVICSAHISTMLAVKKEIEKRNMDTQIQIELYGNYTMDDVESWKQAGIDQVILHHSRDIRGGWNEEEIAQCRKLCDAGMKVTVTGGIGCGDIELFKGLPIYCIIAGRSIRDAEDPKAEAQKMKDEIIRLWGDQT
jgi:3-dehydro-L-gulonate-6-phosphate decarboxylase